MVGVHRWMDPDLEDGTPRAWNERCRVRRGARGRRNRHKWPVTAASVRTAQPTTPEIFAQPISVLYALPTSGMRLSSELLVQQTSLTYFLRPRVLVVHESTDLEFYMFINMYMCMYYLVGQGHMDFSWCKLLTCLTRIFGRRLISTKSSNCDYRVPQGSIPFLTAPV